jgi:spermidine/putrescine ABC transporter ATP-binding subunit
MPHGATSVSSSDTDLELLNVSKRFGQVVAVHDLNLSVAKGELVALLGPSGCGKTTTLHMVAGFERPDTGDIWLRGARATHVPAHRRDTGIVFQTYALFPHMTVFENVAYGLRRRWVSGADIKRRVDHALTMVHLEGLADRYPRQLSGGQQQRVAVARAVVIQPSILLLDEPLSNLDAKLRQQMRGELRALQRKLGITTLFVTHDQDEALSMADRIAVMNAGVVEQLGTAEEVYRRPKTRFVATFVGACNFLGAHIEECDVSSTRLVVAGTSIRISTPGGSLREEMKGTLALRPEDLRVLHKREATADGLNTLAGHITEIVYLGSSFEFRIALSDGSEIVVSRQRDSAPQVAPGDPVKVVWDAIDGVFYPDEV